MAEQLSVEVNVKNVMEDTQTEQQYTQTSFFIWFGYDMGGLPKCPGKVCHSIYTVPYFLRC